MPEPALPHAQPRPKKKASSAQTPDGHTAHNFADLIADLATLRRNELRIGQADHTFTRLTKPTQLQARAFELLSVNPGA